MSQDYNFQVMAWLQRWHGAGAGAGINRDGNPSLTPGKVVLETTASMKV